MSSQKFKILAISGSTKSESSSLNILKYLQKVYSESLEITIYEELDKLPQFNPELNNSLPPLVQKLQDQIKSADGILFCTPEYVFSLPGSLKNLIEWNVSTILFQNKPTAMIIAAASGEKAYESLALILKTIEVKMPKESMLLVKGAKGKVSKAATLTDEKTILDLKKLVDSFANSIAKNL